MYYIYMLRCQDDSIYTGITTDLERRFRQHQGKNTGGAKYTRAKAPVRYEIAWECGDKSSALRLEYKLKRLSKENKESLILHTKTLDKLLGEKLDTQLYNLVKML